MKVFEEELEEHDDRRVRLAIEIFCGALLACAGGADAVIFTGGIGKNSSAVRARICEGMQGAGLTLDKERNRRR